MTFTRSSFWESFWLCINYEHCNHDCCLHYFETRISSTCYCNHPLCYCCLTFLNHILFCNIACNTFISWNATWSNLFSVSSFNDVYWCFHLFLTGVSAAIVNWYTFLFVLVISICYLMFFLIIIMDNNCLHFFTLR